MRWSLEVIERCCATGGPRVREPGEPKATNAERRTSPLHDRRTPADALPASREPLTYNANSATRLTKFLSSAANTSLLSVHPKGSADVVWDFRSPQNPTPSHLFRFAIVVFARR
jgi:hypothetical protein